MRLRLLVLPAAIAALTVSACGDDHSSMDSMSTSATDGGSAATIPADADFNAADVEFAQGMIPHHEQAIEMADMALDPNVGASADVVTLATAIQAGQDPEITLMRGWLDAWGQPAMEDMEGHDMSSMVGMMSAEDMDELGTLTGVEFDKAWLEMMIAHHEGAITMAEDVKANGKNADVATLADAVIAAQTTEIETMTALLGS
ncbi:MAG: hypothetical protein RL238_711 [Actinomycetota bacterium]|jgi:uncharacterized protein (DUF305 family)